MNPSISSDEYRSPKLLSLFAMAGLALVAFCQVAAIAIGIGQIARPDLSANLDSGDVMSIWLMLQGLIYLLRAPIYIATIVAFLMWLNRAHKNLLALRPAHLEFSSGWAVGWWFIPFANLVKPFQVVREIWWESDPLVREDQLFLTASLHSAPPYMGFCGHFGSSQILRQILQARFTIPNDWIRLLQAVLPL